MLYLYALQCIVICIFIVTVSLSAVKIHLPWKPMLCIIKASGNAKMMTNLKPNPEMGSRDYKFLNPGSRDWEFDPRIAITSQDVYYNYKGTMTGTGSRRYIMFVMSACHNGVSCSQFSVENFAKFCGPVRKIPRALCRLVALCLFTIVPYYDGNY